MIETVVVLCSALSIILLGSLVAYKSSRETIRRWFLAFCLALSYWQVMYWLSNIRLAQALLINELTFVGPLLAAGFFMVFARGLYESQTAEKQKGLSVDITLGSVLTLLGICLSLWPHAVIAGIYPRLANGNFAGYNINHGRLYVLYPLIFLAVVAIIVRLIVMLCRSSNPMTRLQAKLVAIGIVLAVGMGGLTNIVLPLILKTSEYSYLGSVAVFVLVVMLSIAIARYKLIDVRLIVARSLAYTLFVALLASVYGLVVFVLANLVFRIHYEAKVQITLSLLAAVIGLTFGGVKKAFTRKTNHIFYQDAYDTQEFLDQLNQALVGNIELEKLLMMCSQVIASNLKAEYCLFGIVGANLKTVRMIGMVKKDQDIVDTIRLQRIPPHPGTNVIVADYLPPEASKLKRLLTNNGVSVLANLKSEYGGTKENMEDLGYIILGQKRSGNMYTSQDVQMLSIIANELVIATQNSLRFEAMQRFNTTLQQQVEQATRKLRQTNKRLVELDETKDDFISLASHQLRTPLTSIKGFLSMMLDGDAGALNETQAKMTRLAFSSSQRMVYLISDLLNISRLRTGKFVIDAAPADLSELVQEEVAGLVETAQTRDIELTYQKPTAFPKLMLDEVKTRQVIMNFIDNAIYYSPPGGHIRVELEEKPAAVELRVVDDGMGVPKSEQHHLFTKFYRAANARKTRPDGTGLGLFMAKKVITAQGGSTVFSSREGHGSTFGFVFSKARLKVPDPAPQEDGRASAKHGASDHASLTVRR